MNHPYVNESGAQFDPCECGGNDSDCTDCDGTGEIIAFPQSEDHEDTDWADDMADEQGHDDGGEFI